MNSEIPGLHKENQNKQMQPILTLEFCSGQPETSVEVPTENEDIKYYKFECLSPKKQEQWDQWKNLLLVDNVLMEEGLKLLGHWPNENEFDDLFQKIAEWREKEIRRLSAQDYLHY